MRKTQKRIFGGFGLLIVMAMTAVAAMMPGPEVLAANSVTDTVTVRVIGESPNAKFDKPEENIVTTNDNVDFIFDYENATSVRMALSYTNKDDETQNIPEYKIYPDITVGAGTESGVINLPGIGLGYGKYVFSLFAKGEVGSELFYDSVAAEYIPVIASAGQNEDDGLVDFGIDSYGSDVETVEVYLGDELIATINRADFNKITKISFDGRENDEYTFDVIAKNASGEILYKPYQVTFDYEGMHIPDTDVPDTGFFFQNLNISKEDYLVTGLIIFFVFGIVAFGIVARGSKRK